MRRPTALLLGGLTSFPFACCAQQTSSAAPDAPPPSISNVAIRPPLRAIRCAVVCLLILIGLPDAFAATLTGRVVDARTGESITNAEVAELGSELKVRTDENGGFTLTDVTTGDVHLLVTCIGYGRITQTVHLTAETSAPTVVALYPEASTPTETVTVTAPVFDTPLDATNPSSEETLSKQEIQALSLVLLGDPMRAAQALPGVTSNNDFDSEFSVRGAGPDQIGVYIDGIDTHDFFDAFSFSSGGVSGTANLTLPIVNADMVSDMSLLKGAYPSNYGDSTAAIFDMDTREGDFNKFSGRLMYGLLGSSAIVDGPFANHRGSWILSGDTSHLSDLTRVIGNIESYNRNGPGTASPQNNLKFNFNNFQNKEVYKISDRQHIGISAIYGNFTLDQNLTTASKNPPNDLDTLNSQHLLADAFWTYAPSANFLAQAKIYTQANQSNDKNLYGGPLDRNGTTETGGRADMSYQFLPSQEFESGVYISNLEGHQTSNSFQASQPTVPSSVLVNYGHSAAEQSFYLQDTWRAKHFLLTGGGRIEHSGLTEQTIALPQGALTYHLGESWTFRAGASSDAQFPTLDEEYGYYSNQSLRAEISNSYNLSVERMLGRYARILTEVYDREDRNQIFSLNGPQLVNGQAELIENPYENSVHGHARGAEITLQRRSANRLTGWVSYAYSETMYHDPRDQLQFISDYDQRHTVNLFASYRLKPTLAISTQYRYGSGMPVPGFVEVAPGGAPTLEAQRDQARLPAYSRLDLRGNKAWSFDRFRLTLAGELLNVTDHANYFFLGEDPMRIQSATDFAAQEKKSAPILPAVSLSVEF
ncbi:MAG: TonB-dependent receptor [Terracidiphilus sp.]